MAKAIRIQKQGGPEVMEWVDVDVGEPGPGELRIRHTAAGLNFVEIYQRSGMYPMSLPSGLGQEGAAVVEAVGEGVTEYAPGDRIAYGNGPPGSYSEQRLIPAEKVVALPDDIEDRTAAGMMLKGMTVHYLLHRTYHVQAGDVILLHAAAGGVGTLLTQWARHLGATVIGTVGSEEKAELARENGCHHVIQYTREDFVERVKDITGGQGVNVVYDSVGKATFIGSLDCLQPLGMMVSFGNASGKVPPVDPIELVSRGSLFFTRPSLNHYAARREDMVDSAQALFDAVGSGIVRVSVNQTYAMRDAQQAQRDLEDRKTTGVTVLLP